MERATDEVYLAGHSAGGQFVHRFWYLHPSRVAALGVSAPGAVTLLDEAADWPSGIRDTGERFGIEVDLAALQGTPVHLAIGADDEGAAELAVLDGRSQPGRTRPERLAALGTSLRDHGITVTSTTVPSAGHDPRATAPSLAQFFAAALGR